MFFTPSQSNKFKVDSQVPIPSIYVNIITAYFLLLVSRVNLKSTLTRLQPRSHLNVKGKLRNAYYVYAAGTTKEKNSVCWLYFTSIDNFVHDCRNQPYFHLLSIFKKTLLIAAVIWPMPIASYACVFTDLLLQEGGNFKNLLTWAPAGAQWGWSKAGYLRGKKDKRPCFFLSRTDSSCSLYPLFVKYISSINQSIFYFTLQIVSFTEVHFHNRIGRVE